MSLSSDPLWLRFVSGPDIDELGLTPADVVAAAGDVVAAHGRGETVFEPRTHLVPDNGGRGHFNVLRGHVSRSASRASAASRWSATSCPTTSSGCRASWRC